MYREEDHTYWLDGERLPSVTELLEPLRKPINPYMQECFDRAGIFGKHVHATIKLWLDRTLDEDTLDENLKAPLEGFKKFWDMEIVDKHDRNQLLCEIPTYHQKLLYAGTPDIVFPELLIDIKTRKYNKLTDPVQLTAYIHLYPEFPTKKPYVLYLDTQGEYKFERAENEKAWGLFKKLLDRYKREKEFSELIKNWGKEKWRKLNIPKTKEQES